MLLEAKTTTLQVASTLLANTRLSKVTTHSKAILSNLAMPHQATLEVAILHSTEAAIQDSLITPLSLAMAVVIQRRATTLQVEVMEAWGVWLQWEPWVAH